MDPSIRGYRPEDLERCRELWAQLTEHHRELYRDPSIGGETPGWAIRFFRETGFAILGRVELSLALSDEIEKGFDEGVELDGVRFRR